MDSLQLVLFTVIAVILLKFLFSYKKKRDLANKIHGPYSLPFIGNWKVALLDPTELLAWLLEMSKQYPRFYRMWLGMELWIVNYDPELTEKVLTNSNLVKSNDYFFLKPWLGKGLLLNEGKNWFNRRKAITPAFHFNILEEFLEIFARNADVLMTKLDIKKPVDVTPLSLKCAFDIICETSMGIEMNSQNESDLPYVKAIHDITTIVYKRMFNPLYALDLVFRFTKECKIFKESMKIVSDTTQRVISSRRKYYEDHPEELKENTNDVGVRKRMPLIDTLLRTTVEGKPLSNQDIEDEVNTFLFAGHDTTSHTLSFFLYNAARYPIVQEKVYEEIINVFGGIPDNSELTTKTMNELKYMEAVIKESMRMYATTPFIGRQILEETTIGDLHLPADTNLSLFLFGMFRSEKLFKNAETFDPDRFTSERMEGQDINPFAFLPFSAGPRNCIGQKFALLEMKTIILKTITTFNISLSEPNKELELVSGMILKAKDGINLKFERRV